MSTDPIRLTGCRPEPLGSYLKGLGVLRLLADQADPGVRGWWQAGVLHLSTAIDRDAIVQFFAERYAPTPLVAPWNGGSGFGENDARSSPTAVTAVETIASSALDRLAAYRSTIEAVRSLTGRVGWYGLAKEEQVALCRNILPDEALAWLDATVVLTTAGRTFPPLLGTGGNDGRFDFSANYMQRVAELIGLMNRKRGAAFVEHLLGSALFGTVNVVLENVAIGQFDPSAAGGPASVAFGSASAVTNPWDFVLLLEGALLFASAAARRLAAGNSRASVPFIVDTSPAGHPTASGGENSRGELWAPLWTRPLGGAELANLIGEGRAESHGRQAENGLGVARALASLGVDRGIEQFVRHAFVERNGLATFAVPVGIHTVHADRFVPLLGLADGWVGRLRGAKNAPGSLLPLLRRFDDAEFDVTRSGEPLTFQEVLVALAELDALAGRSRTLLERTGRLRSVRAADWLPAIDDGSDELRLAVAVCSLRGAAHEPFGWLRAMTTNDQGGRPPQLAALHSGDIVSVLGLFLVELAIRPPTTPPAQRGDVPGLPLRWLDGSVALRTPLGPLARFVANEVDDVRFARLVRALALLDWRGVSALAGSPEPATLIAPALAVLAPLFASRWPEPWSRHAAAAKPGWPQLLLAGAGAEVCEEALRLYRIARLRPTVRDGSRLAHGYHPARLAAACVIPVTGRGVSALLHRVVPDPRNEEHHDQAAAS